MDFKTGRASDTVLKCENSVEEDITALWGASCIIQSKPNKEVGG